MGISELDVCAMGVNHSSTHSLHRATDLVLPFPAKHSVYYVRTCAHVRTASQNEDGMHCSCRRVPATTAGSGPRPRAAVNGISLGKNV